MKNKRFDFRLAYIDLLLNTFVSILFLFTISILLQNPKAKTETAGIKKNAELMVQVDWPKEIDCDVDTWVQDPAGNVVSYATKDAGIMHLERDDLGRRNDYISEALDNLMGYRQILSDINQEIWVLRGRMPGEYTVNVHLYACQINGLQLGIGAAVNVPVTVTLTKLNPDVLVAHVAEVTFKKVWQEITVFNFTLKENGFTGAFSHNVKKLRKDKPTP